jgi:hypothetical protein
MKAFLFGRPEIDLGNLKSTPRLPEWRAQILTSVEPCQNHTLNIPTVQCMTGYFCSRVDLMYSELMGLFGTGKTATGVCLQNTNF